MIDLYFEISVKKMDLVFTVSSKIEISQNF